MTTIQKDRILQFRGQTLRSRDGDKIGSIEEIYLDTETDEPEWALVHTGLFGTKQTFVPLRDASEGDDGLQVPFDKAQVKDAPKVDPDGRLSRTEEAELYRHYGLDYSETGSGSGLGEDRGGVGGATTDGDVDRDAGTTRGDAGDRSRSFGGAPPVDDDVSGPETHNGMTRSEEELAVGTRRQESGRARLRKFIVTEEVQQTVPVQREEVRIEREPITDANVGDATSGPELSEEEHEVVLHEEHPVVEKRVVPKERVRLDKDVETEERTVSEDVSSERIEIEGDARRDG